MYDQARPTFAAIVNTVAGLGDGASGGGSALARDALANMLGGTAPVDYNSGAYVGGQIAGFVLSAVLSEGLSGARVGSLTKGIAALDKEAPLLLNGPIRMTEKGMAHVVERHTVNDIAKFAGKSKFNEGENLSVLINSGTQQRMVQQANGNFARIWDAGRSIGIDRVSGQQTSIMTVITRPNGELVTAFPGRP